MNIQTIKKFAFEFLSIFIGIFAAFALDNWNENRKDDNIELKILSEIYKGLSQDMRDIKENELGHHQGLSAAKFFRNLVLNKPVQKDSLAYFNFIVLRDFISIQNVSGYETLKSKGLEIIKNDSLRTELLSLYENDYNTLRKLEEEYAELQFFEHYHQDFDNTITQNLILNDKGDVVDINTPLKLTEREKKILNVNLSKIIYNREFMLHYYGMVKKNITKLQTLIAKELKR